EKVGKELEKGVKGVGKGLEKGVKELGKGLESLFKRICEDWLKVPDGQCGVCWTNESGQGEVYACSPGDPGSGVPPSRLGQSTDRPRPTQGELDAFMQWREASRPSYEELEPWSDGLARFLPHRKWPGTPIPSEIPLFDVTTEPRVREKDGYGVGDFLAPRALTDKAGNVVGTRYHGGVDYVAKPGEPIFSPVNGKVIRVTNAYKKDNHGLKAIVIEQSGYEFRVLYVEPRPELKVGSSVTGGTRIGTAQNLSTKFKQGMTNHVHLTIIDSSGKRVAPSRKMVIKPRKSK
ncbi:MAG: M23 family metallopeptidase, partial [Deltaproteobacteria bacterium]|nr:M23 family metallopeptidase [Deltaproteobacteria bacterium]